MAVYTRTVNFDNLNTTTDRYLMPGVKDVIMNSNPLQKKLWRKGTKVSGGAYIQQMLRYAEGPAYAFTGTPVFDISNAQILAPATFEWKTAVATASNDLQDEIKNAGKAAQALIITQKVEQMGESMAQLMGQMIFSDGVADTSQITGLRAMVTASGTTYGGISKTTNTWWRSQVDSATTLATLSVGAMRTLMGLCTQDANTPDLIVTTQTIYDKIYGLFQPQQRFADKDMARGGFTNILFEGRPVVVDSHCPTGFMYFLNTKFIDLWSHSKYNMWRSPWKQPHNQHVLSTYMLWAGNLACGNCRFEGVFTGLV
jgi:hypothetical protein